MKPTRTLPENYQRLFALDLAKDRVLMVSLNFAALPLLVLFGSFFWWMARLVRPGAELEFFDFVSLTEVVLLIVAMILVIVLHEAVHGLFFWIYLRDRPTFGFRAAYAFAAAPEWYIPRNPYLVIGLAPLVLISIVGVILFPLIPERGLLPVFVLISLNAAGAVGDLFVVLHLLNKPAETLIHDEGERFAVYLPIVANRS